MDKQLKVKSKVISKNGSVTIPSEIRREYNYLGGEAVDLHVADGKIIIAPHTPSCLFCGETSDVRKFEGHQICGGCIERMAKEAKPNV